jgi:hypothetical protein
MTVQIVPARRALTGSVVRRILGRCALATIGATLGGVSVSTFDTDLGTGYPTAIAVSSQHAPVGRRRIPGYLMDLPDATPDPTAPHTRIVDGLYEELMRWTPPACASASTDASMVGRC